MVMGGLMSHNRGLMSHIGMKRIIISKYSGDGCVLASTLCKYDLRKGDLFGLRWKGCDK